MLPGLGDPQYLLLPENPDPEGTRGYRNSLGAETSLCSQAGDPIMPQGAMRGVLSRPEHPVSPGRGCGGDRDLPALAVLVGLKEKETPGIRLHF